MKWHSGHLADVILAEFPCEGGNSKTVDEENCALVSLLTYFGYFCQHKPSEILESNPFFIEV